MTKGNCILFLVFAILNPKVNFIKESKSCCVRLIYLLACRVNYLGGFRGFAIDCPVACAVLIAE